MKHFTPEDPRFSDTIEIYEPTDRAHADILNVPLKQLLENDIVLFGRKMPEATYQDIQEILAGTYDPYDGGEDDTGEIDDDGTVIEEATEEDIQAIKDSYWT